MSKLFESAARAQLGVLSAAPAGNGTGGGSYAALEEPPVAAASPATNPAPPDARAGMSEARKLSLQVGPHSPVFPFDGSHPYASEQYRILRTRLMHHPKRPRVVVVASAGPRDGKTTTVINLAAVFALRSEARVLLIDGDIRRPSIAGQLGLPQTPGLVQVLEQRCGLEQALIRAEQIPNLTVLTAGEACSNPSELLASAAWKELLARVCEQHDYVFIDSPPMTAVADYALIQSVCDGVVIVLRQDHTRRKHCFEAIRQVPKDKLIGVVVNAVTPWPLDEQPRYDMYYTTYGNRAPGMPPARKSR